MSRADSSRYKKKVARLCACAVLVCGAATACVKKKLRGYAICMYILDRLVFLAIFSLASGTFAARLHEAAANDRTTQISDFLAAGDDIDERDSNSGDTALLAAVRQGNAAHNALRLLLRHGASVHISDRSNNYTPLEVAAITGNHVAARLLVEHGANVVGMHADGLTPLLRAASGGEAGHAQTMRVLIEMGAAPDEPSFSPYALDVRHMTPMDLAANEPSRALLRRFLGDAWRRSKFWTDHAAASLQANAASAWLTVISFVASGAVEDYTPALQSTITANFARAAGVAHEQAWITVEAASVRLSITIASSTQAGANAVKATLAPLLNTTESTSALLPSGLRLDSIPTVAILERSIVDPFPTSDDISSGESSGSVEELASGMDDTGTEEGSGGETASGSATT